MFARAIVGIHSDFRLIDSAIGNASKTRFVIPMANLNYADPSTGRFVSFDVRDEKDQFAHHIQTEVPSASAWRIAWHGDETVVVKSDIVQPMIVYFGTGSVATEALTATIDSISLPAGNVKPNWFPRRNITNG